MITNHVPQTLSSATTDTAARRLYDAETALHAARQTGIDAWITAAYDRLHEAIRQYESASLALSA
jgi:hypothetical protein